MTTLSSVENFCGYRLKQSVCYSLSTRLQPSSKLFLSYAQFKQIIIIVLIVHNVMIVFLKVIMYLQSCCGKNRSQEQEQVIVWRLRGNIIRTAPCWVVWHKFTMFTVSSTLMWAVLTGPADGFVTLGPLGYAVRRGGCLELYYCNMTEWCWWDSSLICKTNWLPTVLWHCWFGHMTCKNRPRNDL